MNRLIKSITEKQAVAIPFALALVLLSAAALYRWLYAGSLLVGVEPYHNALLAKQIMAGSFASQNPYHYLLAGISLVTGVELASKTVPIFLGLVSLLLFYLLLKQYEFPAQQVFVSLLVLVLSPAFISVFSVSNPVSFAVVLVLAGIVLLFGKREGAGVAFLVASSFFGVFSAALAIVILLVHYIKQKNTRFFISASLFILVISAFFYMKFGISLSPKPISLVLETFSDLGAPTGFGVFDLVLAGIGFALLWKQKTRFMLPYALLFFLVISRIVFPSYLNSYLVFVAAFFGGAAFITIINHHFDVKLMKNLTILILLCGLFFSAVSFANRAAHSEPTVDQFSSLSWLKQQPSGIVLSADANSYWITYFSSQPVFLKPDSPAYIFNISADIFYSRNLQTTKSLLHSNSIKYIWIDANMLNGEVWEKPNEGLLFLFRNNETFKNNYRSQDAQVWEVIN